MIDWRNPKKKHNNVPPSLNIYVRYLENNGLYSLPSTEASNEMFRKKSETKRELEARSSDVEYSAAEAQYDSKMVCELPEYNEENLTTHDYILRMSLNVEEQVNLMRQGL